MFTGLYHINPWFSNKFPPDDAFRAGLRKLGPKNNIPEVSLTKKKQKNMNHGTPLFPTTHTLMCPIFLH